MPNNSIEEWNRKNAPFKIINEEDFKIINEDEIIKKNKYFKAKIFFLTFITIILLAFLSLAAIRTYYYDLYRDIVETTNLCEPITLNNITVEKQCGDVEMNCGECLDKDDLEKILENICPDTININLASE